MNNWNLILSELNEDVIAEYLSEKEAISAGAKRRSAAGLPNKNDAPKGGRRAMRFLPAAAVLAFAALLTALLPRILGGRTGDDVDLLSLWESADAVSSSEHSGSVYTAYRALMTAPHFENYVSARVIDETNVGAFLEESTLTAFWADYIGDELSKIDEATVKELPAGIYEIHGLPSELAVCVRFEEAGDALTTTHYYAYYNTAYPVKELASLIGLLPEGALRVIVSPDQTSAHVSTVSESGELSFQSYFLSEEAAASLAERLLALSGQSVSPEPDELLSSCRTRGRLRCELKGLGLRFTLELYDSGYVKLLPDIAGASVLSFKAGGDAAALIRLICESGTEYISSEGTVTGYTEEAARE